MEALIKEFLADDAHSLELPHMTSGQRKQTKKIVDQHPGLRCESFGFGQERQLHIFKTSGEGAGEGLPGIQEQAGASSSAAATPTKGASPPRSEHHWETATTEACSTAASTRGSPSSSPRSSTLLRHIGKPPGLTTSLGVAAVRNTFIHFESSDNPDDRQVQSMPHGMFRQCLWAEALSESVAEQALLSPSPEKEEPRVLEAPEHLELPCSATPVIDPQAEAMTPVGEKHLAPGMEVQIGGLSKCPAFNGRRAVVQSYDEEIGRYDVVMWSAAGEQKAKVKRENLTAVLPLSPAAIPFTPLGSAGDPYEHYTDYTSVGAGALAPCELFTSTSAAAFGQPWTASAGGQFLQAR